MATLLVHFPKSIAFSSKAFLALCIAVLILSTTCCRPAAEDTPTGLLKDSTNSIELGLMRTNTAATRVVAIPYVSKNRLTVKNFTASCRCLKVSPLEESTEPGNSPKFNVSLVAGNKSEDVSVTLGIAFNELPEPWVGSVKASVREPLVISDRLIEFDLRDGSSSTVQRLTVDSFFDNVDTMSYSCDSDWLSVDCTRLKQGRSHGSGNSPVIATASWMVQLKVEESLDAPESKDCIVKFDAETSSGTIHHSEVAVALHNEEPISALPTQLFFGDITRDKPITKNVSINLAERDTSRGVGSLSVTSTLGKAVHTSLKEMPNHDIDLSVTLNPDLVDGEVSGAISVSVIDSPQTTLRIPVRARVIK